MTDAFGRTIDYLRVSLTDRCNLRCGYCMPHGVQLARHAELLSYEELLRVCAAAAKLGIVNFKVTGGEPLVRRGCTGLIARLQALPDTRQVTLTTNGVLLAPMLDELTAAGIDGINISLDTLQNDRYRALTGGSEASADIVLQAALAALARGIPTRINAVLLEETIDELPALAALAVRQPLDVRFIELMPIGMGATIRRVPAAQALQILQARWPDLHPINEKRGNGPARYFSAAGLQGRIGLIDAVSHQFCESCNRVRLTSTGLLKPCLCYGEGTDLRALLRGGCTDEQLGAALEKAVAQKPAAHCFLQRERMTEQKNMNGIGG